MIADVVREPITSREAWLANRKRDVTASDVAALFGKSPYKTMLALYAEKAGLVAPDTEENDAMKRGRYIEPAILAAAREHDAFIGKQLTPATFYYRSPSLRLGATPDALLFEQGKEGFEPVDAKSVASYAFDTNWADGVPLHIQLQVLVQAMLLDAPRGWVACGVMTADFPVHIFEVPRSAKAEQMILTAAAAFWSAIEAGEAPPPTAGDHGTLTALFPRASQAEALDWSEATELCELLEERAQIDAFVKPKEVRKAAIDALIKAQMGAHALALAPGWKVTWKERAAYVTTFKATRVLRVAALNQDQEEAAA